GDTAGGAFLLDDCEPGAAVDDLDLLDLAVLVARRNEEVPWVRPDGFVDLERHVDALHARIVGALADEARRLDLAEVSSGELPYLLVDRAEEGFVAGRSLVPEAHQSGSTRGARFGLRTSAATHAGAPS